MFLSLKQSQIDLLKEEACRNIPLEACALLFGNLLKEGFYVKKVVVTPNILSSPIEFKIDPQLVIAELNKAEIEGLELVGFFHSHPTPPYPSKVDLRNMKLWITSVWLIFSLTEFNLAAYILRNSVIEEIKLVIN